jgi:hypothetical protein
VTVAPCDKACDKASLDLEVRSPMSTLASDALGRILEASPIGLAEITEWLIANPSFVEAVYPPDVAAEHAAWLTANQISEAEVAAAQEKLFVEIFEAKGKAPWSAPAPSERNPRGRPRKIGRVRLEAEATRWLDWNGMPDRQVELERALTDWCQTEDIELAPSTIRTVASGAIRKHKERRSRLE